MAIEFARLEYVSRSSGGNACRKAAYNERESVQCGRTGETFYFKHLEPAFHHEVILPAGVDESFRDSKVLWNAIEHAERRKDSQVAKDLLLALPDDKVVSDADRLELARRFANTYFVSKGLAVQIDIHRPHGNDEEGEKNWHAHMLITTRRFADDGKSLNKTKARDLDPTVRKGRVVEADLYGQLWSEMQNAYFKEKGIDLQVDATGIIAQEHLGPVRFRYRLATDLLARAEATLRANRILSLRPNAILSQLSLNRAVFSERDVDLYLAKHVPETRQAACKIKIMHSDKLLPLYDRETKEPTGYYTTTEVRKQEEKLMRFSEAVMKTLPTRKIHLDASKQLLEKTNLSLEQRQAFDHATKGDTSLVIIQGRAGTGKTTTLAPIVAAHQQAGYRVLGLAPTNKLANDLQGIGADEAMTCHQFLFAIKNQRTAIDKNSFVIVDEAAMLSTDLMVELLAAIKRSGARLLLVGDDRQLRSIERGGMFPVLVERYGAAHITEVRRQKISWQKEASERLSAGEIKEAVTLLQDHQAIWWSGNKQEAIQDLIEYYSQNQAVGEKHFILAQKNDDVDLLNQQARALKRAKGALGKQDFVCMTIRGKASFAEGDRVQLTKTDKALGLHNGMFGTIMAMSTKSCTILQDNGKEVTFDPGHYQGMRHGYAGTVYKAQGSTLDGICVLHDPMTNANTNYVALTRHSKDLRVFVAQDRTRSLPHLMHQMSREDAKEASIMYATLADTQNIPAKETFLDRAEQWLKDIKVKVGDFLHANEAFYRFKAEKPSGYVPVMEQAPTEAPAVTTNAFNQSTFPTTSLPAVPYCYTEMTLPRINAKEVAAAIEQHVPELAKELLGEANKALSSGKELRFGAKGSIAVRLQGKEAGLWYDFEKGEGGNAIQLIEAAKGLSFKEALEYGAQFTGITSKTSLKHATTSTKIAAKEALQFAGSDKDQKQAYVNSLWDKSVPIQGTLAECYLNEHRAIPIVSSPDIRYLAACYEPTTKTSYPAMAVFARDPDSQQVKAAQVTYLDAATANKADVAPAKRSYGKIQGHSVTVQQGGGAGPIYVAEGVETALSIALAKPKAEVIATLGIANMTKVHAKAEQTIILCADHDLADSAASKQLTKAASTLRDAGHSVHIIQPEHVGQDFNDTLKLEGREGVAKYLTTAGHYGASLAIALRERLHTLIVAQGNNYNDPSVLDSQVAKTAALVELHRFTVGMEPSPKQLQAYSLQGRFEANRTQEITKDLLRERRHDKQLVPEDGLRAQLYAERLSGIEGRMYTEYRAQHGKSPTIHQFSEQAERELAQHQTQLQEKAQAYAKDHNVSLDVAKYMVHQMIRYEEMTGQQVNDRLQGYFKQIAAYTADRAGELEKLHVDDTPEVRARVIEFTRRREAQQVLGYMLHKGAMPQGQDLVQIQQSVSQGLTQTVQELQPTIERIINRARDL